MSNEDLLVGTDRRRGHQERFIPQDALNVHVHILGSSGMGKSWLMKHMIKTDIKRNIRGNGPGICLIDPDGDVFNYALEYAARHPLARHRLLVVDTLRSDWSVGLNYLEYNRKYMSASSHAGVVMRGIAKAFAGENTEAMPRLQRWERDALIPLIEAGYTLAELSRFLKSQAFRRAALSKLPEEWLSTRELREEWEFFDQARFSDQLNLVESVLNRANKFGLSEHALSVFGQQRSTIDFRQAMDERKIILCRLAWGKMSPEEIKLLGVAIVDKVVQAGLSRVNQKEHERMPFRFYIDEFAQFVCDDIAEGLDRLRKYKVSMVLAHQRLEQLKRESLNVYSAVMSNCNVKIAFSISREDAEIMAKELFGGELYQNRIKRVIEQTKFWPHEEERIVRAKTYSHTGMHSDTEMESLSQASTTAFGNVQTSATALLFPGETSIFANEPMYTTETTGSAFSSVSGSVDGKSHGRAHADAEAYTEGESEAVVPFYRLEPFREVSTIQDWTVEEKLERFIGWITNQHPRMAQVKIGRAGRPFPILTPTVEDPNTVEAMVDLAVEEALEDNGAAMPLIEARKQIQTRWLALDEEAKIIDAEYEDVEERAKSKRIQVPSAKNPYE